MYAKLALHSALRSAKDYLIYILTLTISVGLFYGFLSTTSPLYHQKLPVQINLDYYSRIIYIVIPLLSLLILFLVSYVNRYMIRRRQKEMALQMVMGMERRTCAFLFFLELLVMGALAIIAGIVLGMLLSEVVGLIILTSFGQPYSLMLALFPDTIGVTLVFFLVLIAVTGLLNIRVIRKRKLIDMIKEAHKTEVGVSVYDLLWKWAIAAVLLALGSIYLLLSATLPVWKMLNATALLPVFVWLASGGLLVLSAALFLIVCRMRRNNAGISLLMAVCAGVLGASILSLSGLFEEMVRNGLVADAYTIFPIVVAAGLLLFCVFCLTSCFSALIAWMKKRNRAFGYRNLFVLGQITAKLGSNAKIIAILACVMICALTLMGWLPVVLGQVDGYLEARSIYDVQVFTTHRNLNTGGFVAPIEDYSSLQEILAESDSPLIGSAAVQTWHLEESDSDIQTQKDMPIAAISLSDYNALRRLAGYEAIALPNGSFATAWSNQALPEQMVELAKARPEIHAGDVLLEKAPDSDYQELVGMGLFTSGVDAAFIIPDEACEGLTPANSFFCATTKESLGYDFAVQLDQQAGEWLTEQGYTVGMNAYIRLRTLQLNEGISNSLMIRLGGAYVCLVLLISCLAVLSLRQLTDAADHRVQYAVLHKIGVDSRQIDKYVLRQMLVWFGVPILMAFLASASILIYLAVNEYSYYAPYLATRQVAGIFAMVFGIALAVLLCYFSATWFMSKRERVR